MLRNMMPLEDQALDEWAQQWTDHIKDVEHSYNNNKHRSLGKFHRPTGLWLTHDKVIPVKYNCNFNNLNTLNNIDRH